MAKTPHAAADFFLGATTPAGFKGYFEALRREPGMQMYLIKSGPGCGKSTLMKQLAHGQFDLGHGFHLFVNKNLSGAPRQLPYKGEPSTQAYKFSISAQVCPACSTCAKSTAAR